MRVTPATIRRITAQHCKASQFMKRNMWIPHATPSSKILEPCPTEEIHLSPPRQPPPMGGCLSRFLLPPLAVICIGAVLMVISLSTTMNPVLAKNPIEHDVPQTISPIFTPEVQHWGGRIQIWASAAGLDPNLAATVMQIESCGDPRALSRCRSNGTIPGDAIPLCCRRRPICTRYKCPARAGLS